MLNEIIEGVAMKLYGAFGDGYEIHRNDVKQGLVEPCFLIAPLSPSLQPLIGRRYLERNPLDVHYFPAWGDSTTDTFRVAATLQDCLEFITLPDGDILHGTGMSYEVEDGVLHFFVSFNLILKKPTDNPPMETLDVDVWLTKGE
jgi:hypothetical protein